MYLVHMNLLNCASPTANFQYAIAFHNETECEECLRENITAENVSWYTVTAISGVHLHACMHDIQ